MAFNKFGHVRAGNTKVIHRILYENKTTNLPSLAIYLDTETKTRRIGKEEHHRMKMAWTCAVRYNVFGYPERETWKFHEDTLDLCYYLNSLIRQKTTTYLFACNLFFDLQVSDFFFYFNRWGWTLDFIYDKGLSYILAIRKGNRLFKLCSTTNYFDTSVKELGKMVGIEKKEVNFTIASKEVLKEYCHRDVEIIKTTMEEYFQLIVKHDLGNFAYTRASQAFRAFRHRFMTTKILFHDNKNVKALERSAYYGGRTECFEIGKIKGGPFLTLDINSMYPFLMRTLPVPVELVSVMDNVPSEYVEERLNKWSVVAEVVVDTEIPLYPIRENNKLVFPVGSFKTFVCSHSMREAIKRGHLREIKKVAFYRQAIVFRDYVDYFFSLRGEYKQSHNSILDRFCKIMLNSLYGKFGQKKPILEMFDSFEGESYYRQEIYNLVKGIREMEYKLFNTLIIESGETDGDKSFCAVSAHITDSARILLWHIIEGIGVENVLYCDTDSIKIRSSDLNKVKHLIDEFELGALKIEEKFKTFEILGPKTYITDTKRVMKGVPVSAELLNHYRYRYDTWLRQTSHLKRGIERYYIKRDTIKQITSEYDKGIVTCTGKIIPFRLEYPY